MNVSIFNSIIKWVLFAVFAASIGCTSDNPSKRDQEREQTRNNADAKRKELEIVVGNYIGQLHRDEAKPQSISLNLQIKEIPQSDGDVDPIMIPVLAGNVQFNYGNGLPGEITEKIVFALEKVDFDVKTNQLNAVAVNSKHKSIVLELSKVDDTLSGSWNSPSSSASGEMNLAIKEEPIRTVFPSLVSDYKGYLLWERTSQYQQVDIRVNSSIDGPDNISLSMTAKLYFGDQNSPEYITYPIENLEFNPITSKFSGASNSDGIILSGILDADGIVGNWSAKSIGQMGALKFSKSLPPVPDGYSPVTPLNGTFKGQLTNTNSGSQLPERVMMSFVTTPNNETFPTISGNIRFYLGPFDSHEYVEASFDSVEFDFFSRKLTAKTSSEYSLTIFGDIPNNKIIAVVYQDGIGEVATLEVSK